MTTQRDSSAADIKGHTVGRMDAADRGSAGRVARRAAALLNGGKKTVILAGQGGTGGRDELEQVADTLGAPIVKALLGKAVVPDDSPYTTGGIGLLGTLPSEKAMEECDSLLSGRDELPLHGVSARARPGQGRAARPRPRPGSACVIPIDIGLTGDAPATLEALLPLLKRRQDRSFLEKAQRRMKEWWELMRRARRATSHR